MTKRLEISGYIIVQLEDQLTPTAALQELIENSEAAGATRIEVKISSRSMTFIDNGSGTNDPNLLVTPAASMSKHVKGTIGSKGIGAKQAMATFGRTWDIQTVPRGRDRFHRYRVVWDENGPLPEQYDPQSRRPAYSAPADIRHGGTKIVVTGRQDGMQIVHLDSLCRSLEKTYRPALSKNGIEIVLSNPELGQRFKLSNAAFDSSKFDGVVRELSSEVHGKSFNVRFGVLRDADSVLSGCHFIYGPRVVGTVREVANLVLPSGCYIDVILGGEWKRALSTNKNRFRYSDDLHAKLKQLLGAWIEAQAAEAKTYRLNLLFGKAAAIFNDTIAYLDKGLAGDHRNKSREIPAKEAAVKDRGERERVQPRHARRTKADLGGEFGKQTDTTKRCLLLEITSDNKLVQLLYRVSHPPGTGTITVAMNTSDRQRTIAELHRKTGLAAEHEVLWLAFMAYASWVASNKTDPGALALFEALRNHRYDIDEDSDYSDIVAKVSNFFIDDLANRRPRTAKEAA